MTVGTRVRELRRKRGLSREQLAVAAGTSSSTMFRLETLEDIPKVEILERIADELGTTASALLERAPKTEAS